MPEGPEIRLAADKIARVLEGQVIDDVYFGLAHLKPFESQLLHQRVSVVDTHGKALLTRFDNGLTLYSHNQLYGRWYTSRRGQWPRTNRQLRVALHTASDSALLYSASEIEILTKAELAEQPFLRRLGPDILDPSLNVKIITERLQSLRFRNRSTGALYLDQKFLAGNGNYLRSEILWAAKVHPRTRPSDLSPTRIAALAKTTLDISRRSYATRGVTVGTMLLRQLKAAGLSYERYRFYVFGREGLACYDCGDTIVRLQVGSRNQFVCETCQRN